MLGSRFGAGQDEEYERGDYRVKQSSGSGMLARP